MSVGARVKIDLDRLRENAVSLRRAVGDFYCVLKSDAYGHGATECASVLDRVGFNKFAVYSLSEAIKLRRASFDSDILILGRTPAKYADALVTNRLIQTVFSSEYAREIAPFSKGMRVHIKLDSGMNRTGFKSEPLIIKKAFFRFLGEIEGVYTHFHYADGEDLFATVSELESFERKARELENLLGKRLIKHSAASAAALRLPRARMDACRIGLALYGVAPNNCADSCKLMPVMSFSAPIVSLSKVKKGENLGYGCDHIAKKDTYTATVSAGYANGLARMAERGFKPCLNGVRVPFAARICMDRCILDITELVMRGVNVRVYDEVEFFGDKASVLELALSENTIPYEALCRVGMMNEKEFLERKS